MLRIFFIIIMVVSLCGCGKGQAVVENTGVVGENLPITRAEAARMVALNSYSIEEINSMERKIEFVDTDISKWYDKYINAAFQGGIIAGTDEEHFSPEEYLTLRQAQFLLDKLKTDNKIKLQFLQEDRDKPIPYNIWVEAFEKNINTEKMRVAEVTIYADKGICKKLGDSFYVTDTGIIFYEGYENIVRDEKINCILNGNTVAALKNINRVESYEDLEVVDCGSNFVEVKLPLGNRKFNIEETHTEIGEKINIKVGEKGGYSIN